MLVFSELLMSAGTGGIPAVDGSLRRPVPDIENL